MKMFESPTRNHFTVIFERVGALLAMFAVFFINTLKDVGWEIFTLDYYRSLLSTASGDGKKTFVILIAVFLFIAVNLYLSFRFWRKTVFYISGTDFIYRRTTMFKTESTLPVQNIAMVNVERNVFERLMGTAKVKIDLNSSRTASKTDFKFVLSHARALELKQALLSLKAEQSQREGAEVYTPSDTHQAAKSGELIAEYTTGHALRHKLLTFPILQSVFSIFIIFVLPLIENDGTPMSRLWFLLFFAIAGSVGSIVMGTLNLGEYTLRSDGKLLYISCGVLNKKSYIFEKQKINAVMINQPLLARVFKLCSVDIAVVGLGNEKNETTHLSLMTDMGNARKIMGECVPDFVCTGEVQRSKRIALMFYAVRAVIIAACALFLRFFYSWEIVLGVSAALLVLLLLGGILEYKSKTLAFDENVMCYTSGIFNKTTGTLKYGDIQDTTIKTNLFSRRSNAGRLKACILSASDKKEHNTGWFGCEVFDEICDRVVAADDNVAL